MSELRVVNRQAEHTLAMARYPGTQPHWVADMSFATPEPILSAIRARVAEAHFSYPNIPDTVYEAIRHWCGTRYNWEIRREWIVIVPNTISGVRVGVKSTDKNKSFFLQRPNYGKLLNLGSGFEIIPKEIDITTTGKPFVASDLAEIERTRPSSVVLCNPTNPSGIVTDRADLEALANSIEGLDTVVISNEAHADFILGERRHVPAGSVKNLENKSITILSPSKTFNLAGISVAYAVIPSRTIRENFISTQTFYSTGINALGLVALEHGYLYCSEWIDKLIVQLRRNQSLVYGGLLNTSLKYSPSDASYLAWIDAREAGDNVFEKLLRRGVAVSGGQEFGSPGWIRLNFACPADQLKKSIATIFGLFGNSK
ncbi:aminotransferase class I/II-fold pyridoxal phosphate-dependent enzyme [Pseudomonas sp. S1Bt23]|uniref:aminotransferase class I/II-fold pyridoxal phosphate-dependent enzyme n=1 Tax=Pseudomonas sp. S1Bt23 TaxID=3095074 RepID=UPI002A5A5331|nr:aminotransferase class I/II-fold pyridoxal phosphate-dependent enzyme [Pseudomonas sp. S1Bt23]WPO46649.1 aminotransferase class I/II-fold pyridoxal phosphate-dependent enzyme [Pseudomonas sp. S1Bt23]